MSEPIALVKVTNHTGRWAEKAEAPVSTSASDKEILEKPQVIRIRKIQIDFAHGGSIDYL